MPITADRVVVELEAKVDRYMARVNQAESRFNRGMTNIRGDALRTETAVNRSFSNMGLAVGGLTASLGIREIARYADTWTEAGNQIAAAAQISGRSARSLSAIGDIADETRSSIRETTNLYARLLRSTADVAESEEDVARATRIVNQAFVAGGAAASERAAGILQLGQALGSGFLQGDELRSIRENAPLLAQAIADEFGVTIGALKELGAEGEITSDRVFNAILNAQGPIAAAFAETNSTISDSLTRLQNSLIEYIGLGNEANGTTEKISTALSLLADNIDLAVVAGVALGGRFIGPILLGQLARSVGAIRAASGALTGLSAGAASAAASLGLIRGVLGVFGGPVGLAITALTALPILLTDSAERVGQLQSASSGAVSTLADFAKASRDAADDQEELGGKVAAATQRILEQSRAQLQQDLSGLRDEFEDFRSELEDGIVFNSDATSLGQNLGSGAAGQSDTLSRISEQLLAIGDGAANIGLVSQELERLAGIGEEVTNAVANFDTALEQSSTVDLGGAQEQLEGLARSIGGFEDELQGIANAGSEIERAVAFNNLRNALQEAAAAGAALQTENAQLVREQIRGAADAETAIKAVELALEGNTEEALRVAAGIDGAVSAGITLNNTEMGGGIGDAADEAARLAGNLALAAQLSARPGQAADLADEDAVFAVPVAPNSRSRQQNRRSVANLQRVTTPRSSSGGGGGGGSTGPSGEEIFQEAIAKSNLELERQLEALGKTSAELAGLRANYELLDLAKQNDIDLNKRIGDGSLTAAELIAKQALEVERLTELYENNKAASDQINQGLDDIASATADALTGGESLRDGFRTILSQIANDILTSSIRESLTRVLTPDVGGLGGGGLFGGILSGLGSLVGFMDGGFTGQGAANEPAGVVHRGEYVFTKGETDRIGVENLRAIADGRLPGYMTGGLVGNAPSVSSAASAMRGGDGAMTVRLILPPGLSGEQIQQVGQISGQVAIEVVEQNNKSIPGLVAEAQEQFG